MTPSWARPAAARAAPQRRSNDPEDPQPGHAALHVPPGLSQTDAYFEGNDYQKGPPNDYSVGANIMWIYSLKDMYALAGAIGANPWVSIPDVFNDTDVTSFASNLCSAFAANGFSKAFIEQSDEDWVTTSHSAGGSHLPSTAPWPTATSASSTAT